MVVTSWVKMWRRMGNTGSNSAWLWRGGWHQVRNK